VQERQGAGDEVHICSTKLILRRRGTLPETMAPRRPTKVDLYNLLAEDPDKILEQLRGTVVGVKVDPSVEEPRLVVSVEALDDVGEPRQELTVPWRGVEWLIPFVLQVARERFHALPARSTAQR
jgi:hypothetical protein